MRFINGSVLALVLGLLAGCSDGPKVVQVSGKVTRAGKPVPGIFLNFEPDNGRPSWASADDNGNFKLNYDEKQDGAVVGKHTVWVLWRPRNPQEEMIDQGMAKGKTSKPKDLAVITEKFGSKEKSPLKIEITKSVSDLEIKLD